MKPERNHAKASVLVVGPLMQTGGVSRFVGDLLALPLGIEVLHHNTARPPKRTTKRAPIGYASLFARGALKAAVNSLLTLKNLCVFALRLPALRPSVVHIATSSHWSFWESLAYVLLSKALRVKVILHFLGDFHTFYGGAGPVERALIRAAFRAADKTIVLSDSVSKILTDVLDVRDVTVLPSFIDTEAIKGPFGQSAAETGSRMILYMGGNYGARKGVYDAVKVAHAVLPSYADANFCFCGAGDVEDACRGMNRDPRFTYLGLVDEDAKSRLLDGAYMYLLPSYSEGVPYGIMEAMAHGVPVIATNIGGIPEVVEDKVNGFLVQPGDIAAIQRHVSYLLDQPVLAQAMGRANAEKIERFYSARTAIGTLSALYAKLLEA